MIKTENNNQYQKIVQSQHKAMLFVSELFLEFEASPQQRLFWKTEWFLRDTLYLCIKKMMQELSIDTMPLDLKFDGITILSVYHDENWALYTDEEYESGSVVEGLPLVNHSDELFEIYKRLHKTLKEREN